MSKSAIHSFTEESGLVKRKFNHMEVDLYNKEEIEMRN